MALSQIKKNKLWIWKAISRQTGRLIDRECGNRDAFTLQRLMERLKKLNVDKFYTDHWDVYSKLIPADKLKQSKSETVAIERNNSRQRHWFARFRRKSIVVSKSLEMVDLTMSLFARFHVNGKPEEIVSLFG